MRKKLLPSCFLILWFLVCLPPPGQAEMINAGMGVSFDQLSFTFPSLTAYDSQYGQVYVDYAKLASSTNLSSGFVNVRTAAGWVVQNVPVSISSGIPGLSTMFGLGGSGPLTTLSSYVDYSPQPSATFSGGPLSTFAVGQAANNAQGMGGDITGPLGRPNPPLTFPGTATEIFYKYKPAEPSVQTYINQCGPASVANSLEYLRNTYGLKLRHRQILGVSGSPVDSMVGQIDKSMERVASDTVSNTQFIEGKLKYLGSIGIQTLIIEHQGGEGKTSDGKDIATNDVTAGGITSKNMGAIPTADWILGEVKKCEDVELVYTWPGADGKRRGHAVQVTGGGKILGRTYITFVHDAKQGDKSLGTDLYSGGYGFTYVEDVDGDGYLDFYNYINTEPDIRRSGRIDFVMAESVPAPPSLILLGSGLLGLGGWRRLKKG
jgi:hypothetical protein